MNKVALLGIDGVPYNFLKLWLDAGYLPHLLKFAKSGVMSPLKSVIPYVSPAAWASIASGVDPVAPGVSPITHGILGFRMSRGQRGHSEIVNASTLSMPTVWQLLAGRGFETGLYNWPLSWPAAECAHHHEKVRIISGWIGAPHSDDSRAFFPDDLREQYDWEPLNPARPFKHDVPRYIEAAKAWIWHRWEVFQRFHQVHDFDFPIAVIFETDLVLHIAMDRLDQDPYDPLVLGFFQELDKVLGEIFAILDGYNIFLVSDHGMQLGQTRFKLQTWLLQNGMIKPKQDIASVIRYQLWRYGWCAPLFQRMISGLKPKQAGDIAGQITSDSKRDKLLRLIFFSSHDVDPDSPFVVEGDPVGIVYGSNQKAFRELERKLANEGLGYVVSLQDFGDLDATKPTAIIHPADEKTPISASNRFFSSKMQVPTAQIGIHSIEGVFGASGPQIRQVDTLFQTPSLIDIAPTILAVAGGYFAPWMQGKAMSEILTAQCDLVQEVEPLPGQESLYTSGQDEADEVEERLRELGY